MFFSYGVDFSAQTGESLGILGCTAPVFNADFFIFRLQYQLIPKSNSINLDVFYQAHYNISVLLGNYYTFAFQDPVSNTYNLTFLLDKKQVLRRFLSYGGSPFYLFKILREVSISDLVGCYMGHNPVTIGRGHFYALYLEDRQVFNLNNFDFILKQVTIN